MTIAVHGRDSILVPHGLSLIAAHGHNDGALTAANIAFQMEICGQVT
jgi:hypothetical protein